jgi:hypothetical protein
MKFSSVAVYLAAPVLLFLISLQSSVDAQSVSVDTMPRQGGKKGGASFYVELPPAIIPVQILECFNRGLIMCGYFQTVAAAFETMATGEFIMYSTADGNDITTHEYANGVFVDNDEESLDSTETFGAFCCDEVFNHDGEGDTRRRRRA